MDATKTYEEIVDFIAGGTTPKAVVAFRPSEAARRRVDDLVEMTLAKARARQHLLRR